MKQPYQYSKGIFVHERPGEAILTNEVELGLVSPARISKYINWVRSGDVFYQKAADMIIPSCKGPGVVKKLLKWLSNGEETVRRSASLGLMHQQKDDDVHEIAGKSLMNDPDSIVQFRLVQVLARHGTMKELSLLREFSQRPTPASPPGIC